MVATHNLAWSSTQHHTAHCVQREGVSRGLYLYLSRGKTIFIEQSSRLLLLVFSLAVYHYELGKQAKEQAELMSTDTASSICTLQQRQACMTPKHEFQ